ncbi:hypothetical protein BY458DRAFT_499899 [Sporodiniella umbellata]|nr:hypothetical protein BY458DRAFT_499899 [Sporodiniella umbellata]
MNTIDKLSKRGDGFVIMNNAPTRAPQTIDSITIWRGYVLVHFPFYLLEPNPIELFWANSKS